MRPTPLEREEIKYVLRKRHGSIVNFADARGLTAQSVTDFLRGRASKRVADVVKAELQQHVTEGGALSIKLDGNAERPDAHRINSEAR